MVQVLLPGEGSWADFKEGDDLNACLNDETSDDGGDDDGGDDVVVGGGSLNLDAHDVDDDDDDETDPSAGFCSAEPVA